MTQLQDDKNIVGVSVNTNAITLLEAQKRLFLWQKRIADMFNVDYADMPRSIYIPLQDLKNIVDGFNQLGNNNYNVTGARLYLTFDSTDNVNISGVVVPVGTSKDNLQPHDIIIDVNNPDNLHPVIGPDTLISVYDFTLPCPPLGECSGSSSLLGQQ